ncbi:MAG: hypothetical protein FJ399_05625 [Verrucomicrobia bacterium]|nr:hypothetical protein [Verrucomicrobiota bacterium]
MTGGNDRYGSGMPQISPLAHIESTARIAADVVIEAGAWIGPDVELQRGAVVQSGAAVGRGWAAGRAGATVVGAGCIIGSGAVIYHDVTLADGVKIWHNAVIRHHVEIGRGTSIGSLSCIEHHTTIGAECSVHGLCQIGDYSTVGDAVFIGPGFLSVSDLRLDYRRPQLHETYRGVTIKRGARVGGRVLAYPGSVVGVETVVGAGSAIRGELLDGVVYLGDPIRAVRKVRPDERWPEA